jgi:3-oxoacyl-[acyl-carrier-protein] synthase II
LKIAISGWGLVAAAGCGPAAADRAFGLPELPLREVDRSAGYHRPAGARLAALVDEAAYQPWLPARVARRMSPPSRFSVVAAKIAMERAGLAAPETADAAGSAPPPLDLSVVISTSFGPSSYTEELLRQIFHDSPTAASPFLFTEAVANAPAAQIALALKAFGPNLTVTGREAGPLFALDHGKLDLENGRSRRALIASVDEMNPLLHAGLDRYGALAGSRRPRRGEPAEIEVARPFDRRRNGFLAAEGSTALLVEPIEEVLARGLRPVAVLGGFAAAFDPTAEVASYGREPGPTGEALARELGRQGISLDGIDAIVSSAAGSRQGDEYEALLLRAAFGNRQLPPVLAPKAYAGSHGGALLAFTCWLLDGGRPAPTPGFAEVDPALGIRPYAGESLPASPRLLLSAPAVGGGSVFQVLEGVTG